MIRTELQPMNLNLHSQSMWTVYDRPSNFPTLWVARRWEVRKQPMPTSEVLLADSLEALRIKLPAGLTRLERQPADEPAVVEVWL